MDKNLLTQTAKALLVANKGILAADESANTVEKRFKPINLENTEDNRRVFRELFFTAPGISQYISGVILFDETIRQKASNGKTFVEILKEQGIVPGIKVDKGLADLPNSPGEKITQGLDGLAGRLAEYVSLGAKFAKWRAEINIGPGIPTDQCIGQNNKNLSEYAALCQEAGLVPIVEPEVMMSGNHSLEQCREITEKVQQNLFSQLAERGVFLEGLILKSNMVIAGKDFSPASTAQEVAAATVETFLKTVPKNVAGIVFLSGGESEPEATANLNQVEKQKDLPWPITFSFARALQDSATRVWAGKPENFVAAQKVFVNRALLDSLARAGEYSPAMEVAGVQGFEQSQASQD